MCKKCFWAEYLDKIDDMLRDKDYEFADNILQGIRNWVISNEHITDEQANTVESILEVLNECEKRSC